MSANKNKYFEVSTIKLVKAPNKTQAMTVASGSRVPRGIEVIAEAHDVTQQKASELSTLWELDA